MIRCKARFHLSTLLWISIIAAFYTPLTAQAYLAPRLYEFDRGVYDYTQKHLSDKLHYLLWNSQFSVPQVGYSTTTGNFTNLQIMSDFKSLAAFLRMGILPQTFDTEVYNAERALVLFYENLARRWERLNPIPGLYYTVIIRSPAYPFLFMETLDKNASVLGTFPFMDDQKVRLTKIAEQQFAFGFRLLY